MNFQEACDELSCLLEKSNGEPIPFEDGQKIFTPIKKYTNSAIIFQGYMQPDGRGYIWQDIAIITAITFTYTFYVFKVILKTTD